jgi:hypothetical protein
MFRKIALILAAGGLAAAPFLASTIAAQNEPARSITLYNGENLQGAGVTLTRDVANLQSVPAAEGFDGTANDYAFSLKTEGRWEVCMDAGFERDCMVVDGEVASLGDRGGSISSVRYLGPSMNARAAAVSRAPQSSGAAYAAAAADGWQPMYNVDLFGNDYREITYKAPGSDWRTCKASCDGDKKCKAWTYVGPGRTEYGECFLKRPVPRASSDSCCISGIKGAASAGGASGDAAIERSLQRLGDTAGNAAESELNNAVDRKVRGLLGKILD